MIALNSKTPCLVTEVNPHLQMSSAWLGAMNVGDVIAVVAQKTAFSATQPEEFLLKNNGAELANFLGTDREFDSEKYTAWADALPIQAHFDAAIECEAHDGHTVRVYFTKDEALNGGAPRYMSDAKFEQAVNLVFGE